jgi:polyisoprenoid-binding protein YceI
MASSTNSGKRVEYSELGCSESVLKRLSEGREAIMRRTFCALLALVTSPLLSGSEFVIQPAPDCQVHLTIYKTGLMSGRSHSFVFERYHGLVRYDAANPQASFVSLDIESASATCKDTWVSSKDLRKIEAFALNDMLDSDHHPSIHFESAAVKPLQAKTYEVQGTLTIRDIAKPVKVSVTVDGVSEEFLTFRCNAVIRLTDYHLRPPTAALGTIGTKDEITAEFRLKAVKKSATQVSRPVHAS